MALPHQREAVDAVADERGGRTRDTLDRDGITSKGGDKTVTLRQAPAGARGEGENEANRPLHRNSCRQGCEWIIGWHVMDALPWTLRTR